MAKIRRKRRDRDELREEMGEGTPNDISAENGDDEGEERAADDEEDEERDEEDEEREEEDEERDEEDEERDEEDEERDEEDEEREEEDEEDEREDQGASTDQPKSSRLNLWIALAVAVVIVGYILLKPDSASDSGTSKPAIESNLTEEITLITADRNDLECAAEKGFQSYQCGYSSESASRQIGEAQRLRPFMTTGNRRLFLIPGLFLDPALKKRYESEPPTGKTRKQLKRFTAKCKLQVIGEIDNVKLRWSPSGNWEGAKTFPVATASDCKVEG